MEVPGVDHDVAAWGLPTITAMSSWSADEVLRFEFSQDERVCTVRVFGEIDVANAEELRRRLERALDATPEGLVVDLSGLVLSTRAAFANS